MTTLHARIFGVSQSDMNTATTLQYQPDFQRPNRIEVTAIDGTTETKVFAGNIINAWGDYMEMPDICLTIMAAGMIETQLKPVPPISLKGNADTAEVMGLICRAMGMKFENNGVNTKITDPYLANTAMEQARELARSSGCDFYADDDTIAITPRNAPRFGVFPLISFQSGLVGYPTFDGVGVMFKTLFNPSIRFGGQVQLQTDVTRAAGSWIVTSIAHLLESERPGGAWFSTVRANRSGLAKQ